MKITPLIGAHMSIARGLEQSIITGQSIGCTAIQIFLHSNRQWHMKELKQEQIDLFDATLKQSSVRAVVVHASYLINLGSPNSEIRSKSITVLTKELQQCSALGIPALILHPGSTGNGTIEECIRRIATGLDKAIEATPGNVMLLLENTAGQGVAVGSTFEELAHIRELSIHKKRVGFCFDTCHAFAAGYNFTTEETYTSMWKDFDKILGLEHLKTFHVNDSKKGLGSRVDRHEDIGQGKLGLEPFRLILNDKRFAHIPKILETPTGDNWLADDQRNLETLRNLLVS